MELDFAFFAKAAEVESDGMIHLLGGGITFVKGPAFPAIQHGMVLVVRLRVEPNECDCLHELVSQIVRPSGAIMPPEIKFPFSTKRHPWHPEKANTMTVVLNYIDLIFPEEGEYTFRLLVDGVGKGQTTFDAIQEG